MKGTKQPAAVVVIPALDEDRTIGKVVEACVTLGFRVVVVDDGSSDRTAQKAKAAGAQVIRHERNLGVGAAYRSAFSHIATAVQSPCVVTMDGDGVHDPNQLEGLLALHQRTGASLTIGSRFMSEVHRNRLPSTKRVANFFATQVINWMTSLALSDVSSGIRVLDQKAMNLPARASGYGAVYEAILLANSRGLKIVQGPIQAHYNADELHCTKQSELLDFLDLVLSYAAREGEVALVLRELRTRVARMERMHLRVADTWLVVHPLREYAAFSFQEQDERFVQLCKDWRRVVP